MKENCGTNLTHEVVNVIVGYGTRVDGTKYWLVKNSWGEEGYMRLLRGYKKKEGLCGVAVFSC